MVSPIEQVRALGVAEPRAIPPALGRARASFTGALAALLQVPDGALQRPWTWRGLDGAANVRYGFYRLYELLEEAAVAVDRLRLPRATGGLILGQATAALWDLHGLLVPLDDADLDRPPGGGEWTLRQTLGHVIQVQQRYTLSTAWAAHRVVQGGDLPPQAPNMPPRLDAPTFAGGLADARRALDEWTDMANGLLGGLDDAAVLAGPSVWAGYEVDVRFRLHRFGAHLREHTIQVAKTLALLDRRPSEVERLVGLIAGAYGRLEGACLGAPSGTFGPIVEGVVAIVARHADEVCAAAR